MLLSKGEHATKFSFTNFFFSVQHFPWRIPCVRATADGQTAFVLGGTINVVLLLAQITWGPALTILHQLTS
jgi:uncharacterized membrane protein